VDCQLWQVPAKILSGAAPDENVPVPADPMCQLTLRANVSRSRNFLHSRLVLLTVVFVARAP